MKLLDVLVRSPVKVAVGVLLVVLFGLMIAPLGVVSIFFIIIQPILIGTWSTLALIGVLWLLPIQPRPLLLLHSAMSSRVFGRSIASCGGCTHRPTARARSAPGRRGAARGGRGHFLPRIER